MEQGTPEGPGSTHLELVAPADPTAAPALYANFVQVTLAPHDFTFHFGWFSFPAFMQPPDEDVSVPVRPLIKVSVPLTLVRGIINVLQAQVAAWEQGFGQSFPEEPHAIQSSAPRGAEDAHSEG